MAKKPASGPKNGEMISDWENDGGALEQRKERPGDAYQLAKFIVDVATGEIQNVAQSSRDGEKKSVAARSGHLGGLKDGKARAAAISKKQLSERARKAANAQQRRR